MLDEKIKLIFFRMINNSEKITKICGTVFNYGDELSLQISPEIQSDEQIPIKAMTFEELFKEHNYLTVFNLNYTGQYKFIINTPFRNYIVPKLTRAEYASALDNLEQIMQDYEENELNKYIDFFKMKVDNRSILITDPCYILTEEDINNDPEMFCLPDSFTDYISESTLYGDWSCTTFIGPKLNISVGEFCADCGMVCVVFVDELLKYNPEFFINHGTWTYTIIPNFTGTVEYEVDEENEAHIVGYLPSGDIYFKTMQTGA